MIHNKGYKKTLEKEEYIYIYIYIYVFRSLPFKKGTWKK